MGSGIPGEPHATERPAGTRREEVAIRGAGVTLRRGAAAAPQDVLAHHELAVVFTDRPGSGTEAGIRGVGTRRPFPRVAVHAIAGDCRKRVRRASYHEVVAQEIVALAVEG